MGEAFVDHCAGAVVGAESMWGVGRRVNEEARRGRGIPQRGVGSMLFVGKFCSGFHEGVKNFLTELRG
jgi:hypothetical protein